MLFTSRHTNSSLFESISSVVPSIIGMFVVAVLLVSISNSAQFEEVDAVILDKMQQQLVSKDGTEYRYIISTDKGTFLSEQNFLVGKFESTDTYLTLKEGHKYHLKLVGFGKSLLTDYKNIVDAKEIR